MKKCNKCGNPHTDCNLYTIYIDDKKQHLCPWCNSKKENEKLFRKFDGF